MYHSIAFPFHLAESTALRGISSDEIHSLDKITLQIDHSDGRQISLSLPASTTLKSLYHQVADSLGLPSISLVFNNRTLKLDEQHQSMSLKQLHFSSDNVQLLESYPVIRKLKIFIQTSTTSTSIHWTNVTIDDISFFVF
jgi:hypothetical protein